MTLIIVSDFDPEGFGTGRRRDSLLALHKVPVDGHRIAVTPEQIQELGLAEDFNPAKESSSRYKSFVKRSGGTKHGKSRRCRPTTWSSRSRPRSKPTWTSEVYKTVCDQEEEDCGQLCRIRKQIASQLEF